MSGPDSIGPDYRNAGGQPLRRDSGGPVNDSGDAHGSAAVPSEGPFERLTPPEGPERVRRLAQPPALPAEPPLGASNVASGVPGNRTEVELGRNGTPHASKKVKVPQWVQRYREGAPLDPIECVDDNQIERRYDPILQALLRAHPAWQPNNQQRDFVLRTRSAADRLQPVSELRRIVEGTLGTRAHDDRVMVAENFGLALSNLLLHRYPSSNDVIALHPDRVARRPSDEPESDRLASLWLVESLIYMSANRPEVLRELTARVDSIRNFEMECECHFGIDERLRGVHFGAEVNSTLVMATVATYCRSAHNPEARELVENLFCLLTGVGAPTARRALEGAELEVQVYQAEHGPLNYWQPL